MSTRTREPKPSKSGRTRTDPFEARHETFCIGIVAGLSQLDAYIGAGFKTNGTRIGNNGPTTLMKRLDIQHRIAVLQAFQRIRLNISVNTLDEDLIEIRTRAKAAERF